MSALVTGLGWRYRMVVVVPMALLGVFDSLVALVTLGFIQPGVALSWGFHLARRTSTDPEAEALLLH